jgi:hypothetical protein
MGRRKLEYLEQEMPCYARSQNFTSRRENIVSLFANNKNLHGISGGAMATKILT